MLPNDYQLDSWLKFSMSEVCAEKLAEFHNASVLQSLFVRTLGPLFALLSTAVDLVVHSAGLLRLVVAIPCSIYNCTLGALLGRVPDRFTFSAVLLHLAFLVALAVKVVLFPLFTVINPKIAAAFMIYRHVELLKALLEENRQEILLHVAAIVRGEAANANLQEQLVLAQQTVTDERAANADLQIRLDIAQQTVTDEVAANANLLEQIGSLEKQQRDGAVAYRELQDQLQEVRVAKGLLENMVGEGGRILHDVNAEFEKTRNEDMNRIDDLEATALSEIVKNEAVAKQLTETQAQLAQLEETNIRLCAMLKQMDALSQKLIAERKNLQGTTSADNQADVRLQQASKDVANTMTALHQSMRLGEFEGLIESKVQLVEKLERELRTMEQAIIVHPEITIESESDTDPEQWPDDCKEGMKGILTGRFRNHCSKQSLTRVKAAIAAVIECYESGAPKDECGASEMLGLEESAFGSGFLQGWIPQYVSESRAVSLRHWRTLKNWIEGCIFLIERGELPDPWASLELKEWLKIGLDGYGRSQETKKGRIFVQEYHPGEPGTLNFALQESRHWRERAVKLAQQKDGALTNGVLHAEDLFEGDMTQLAQCCGGSLDQLAKRVWGGLAREWNQFCDDVQKQQPVECDWSLEQTREKIEGLWVTMHKDTIQMEQVGFADVDKKFNFKNFDDRVAYAVLQTLVVRAEERGKVPRQGFKPVMSLEKSICDFTSMDDVGFSEHEHANVTTYGQDLMQLYKQNTKSQERAEDFTKPANFQETRNTILNALQFKVQDKN